MHTWEDSAGEGAPGRQVTMDGGQNAGWMQEGSACGQVTTIRGALTQHTRDCRGGLTEG